MSYTSLSIFPVYSSFGAPSWTDKFKTRVPTSGGFGKGYLCPTRSCDVRVFPTIVQSLASKHPDVKSHHIIAVLAMRGDLGRAAVTKVTYVPWCGASEVYHELTCVWYLLLFCTTIVSNGRFSLLVTSFVNPSASFPSSFSSLLPSFPVPFLLIPSAHFSLLSWCNRPLCVISHRRWTSSRVLYH